MELTCVRREHGSRSTVRQVNEGRGGPAVGLPRAQTPCLLGPRQTNGAGCRTPSVVLEKSADGFAVVYTADCLGEDGGDVEHF